MRSQKLRWYEKIVYFRYPNYVATNLGIQISSENLTRNFDFVIDQTRNKQHWGSYRSFQDISLLNCKYEGETLIVDNCVG